MRNMCSKTCSPCVRKIILILYLRQMLRIVRYLPVHCVKGAEFASMRNMCSKTCPPCVRKIILILYLRQMLRIARYLPMHCAKGAEFASFAVYFWSSLG